MKKFKKAIRRSSTMKDSNNQQHTMTPPSPPGENKLNMGPNPPSVLTDKLSLRSQDISEVERPLFEKYWDELDPFGIGKVSRPYIITFLVDCHLSDHHIQQIISLFEHQYEWEQNNVYALLRLVSHIKHGRDINADLIYLPAPSVPVMTEFPVSYSYSLNSNHHLPRFRSFSDPSIWTVEDTLENQSTKICTHHQRRSVDDATTRRTRKKPQLLPSSLLLMQAFIPPPSPSSDNHNPFHSSPTSLEQLSAVPINLKSNHSHIPPPPVPSQKTKPPSLLHSKVLPTIITNPKNIFDTPPNYHLCEDKPTVQQNRSAKKTHRPAR